MSRNRLCLFRDILISLLSAALIFSPMLSLKAAILHRQTRGS
jgi:hypothetical protein